LKIEEARFGFDKQGSPCLIAKCQIGIDEKSGKFGCGFALAQDSPKGKLYLFAFRDTPRNAIAIANDTEQSIKWLQAALEKNGYKWYHFYYTGVQEDPYLGKPWYAFMVPFDAEGWNELPESVRQDFQKMLDLLKSRA